MKVIGLEEHFVTPDILRLCKIFPKVNPSLWHAPPMTMLQTPPPGVRQA